MYDTIVLQGPNKNVQRKPLMHPSPKENHRDKKERLSDSVPHDAVNSRYGLLLIPDYLVLSITLVEKTAR